MGFHDLKSDEKSMKDKVAATQCSSQIPKYGDVSIVQFTVPERQASFYMKLRRRLSW